MPSEKSQLSYRIIPKGKNVWDLVEEDLGSEAVRPRQC